MENEHIDSWKKYPEIFIKQLELNKKQLKGEYPDHWKNDYNLLKSISPKRIYELSCGVGSFYRFAHDNFNDIESYIGTDYSEDAVSLANQSWGSFFEHKNVYDINCEDVKNYNILYSAGLIEIIPDQSLLEKILALGVQYVLVSKIYLTNQESFFEVYEAYDKIKTYRFKLNENKMKEFIDQHNYKIADSIMLNNYGSILFEKNC